MPKQPSAGAHRNRRSRQEVSRELVVGEPAAGLEHGDPVALLDQPQRGHAPAEPGADDHHVVAHVTIVTRQ